MKLKVNSKNLLFVRRKRKRKRDINESMKANEFEGSY